MYIVRLPITICEQQTMLIKIINSEDKQIGFFKPHEFCRVKSTSSKIVSSAHWSYVQNKNILHLECKTNLAILCTRCLMLVKKSFEMKKAYKIFKTINEANDYSANCLDDYEIISLEEGPTILSLIEDELIFEFFQIIVHVGCQLPEDKYLKQPKSQELNFKKNKINNPFAKLKEKFRK